LLTPLSPKHGRHQGCHSQGHVLTTQQWTETLAPAINPALTTASPNPLLKKCMDKSLVLFGMKCQANFLV
ncbi:MAG: hypothetical protein MI674_04650, partial [Cytophagales bacterium]|nr:hypothetical protein [Cytophagales bacterium]